MKINRKRTPSVLVADKRYRDKKRAAKIASGWVPLICRSSPVTYTCPFCGMEFIEMCKNRKRTFCSNYCTGKSRTSKIPEPTKQEYDARTLSKLLNGYTPEPNSGCWLWNGALNTGGYATTVNARRARIASREVFRLIKGVDPKGGVVCHKCDTPACINPDHLWLGTHGQNLWDSVMKGRRTYNFNINNRTT